MWSVRICTLHLSAQRSANIQPLEQVVKRMFDPEGDLKYADSPAVLNMLTYVEHHPKTQCEGFAMESILCKLWISNTRIHFLQLTWGTFKLYYLCLLSEIHHLLHAQQWVPFKMFNFNIFPQSRFLELLQRIQLMIFLLLPPSLTPL